MSFVTAFAPLYAAQTSATGFAYTATVGAAANKNCISSELSYDEIIVHGGEGEKGGYELKILETDVPLIDKYQAVAVKRNGTDLVTDLQVLNYKRNNGVMEIIVGDPAVGQ